MVKKQNVDDIYFVLRCFGDDGCYGFDGIGERKPDGHLDLDVDPGSLTGKASSHLGWEQHRVVMALKKAEMIGLVNIETPKHRMVSGIIGIKFTPRGKYVKGMTYDEYKDYLVENQNWDKKTAKATQFSAWISLTNLFIGGVSGSCFGAFLTWYLMSRIS